ncbi:YmdB family metallophosphoesterase [Ruminococcaceae bacterium OttesenSCG-928-D13]|nr:YmdB family metallophosphoesterase [Ruminococcaceae bacterium OttesenSCG-928-D13]
MNILCVGDVVGERGVRFACDRLPALRRETGADLVVVNAENADKSGTGLRREEAEALLTVADVLTGGNHSYDRADEKLYTEQERVLHPANYPFTEDAAGCCLIDTGRLGTVRVISLCGVAFMDPLDNPFKRVDALLAAGEAKYTVVDFHAESTAEKKALAFHLDGRVSAVFGTHTHVQTADEQVLPAGTGFITDVGMTGPAVSVLGMAPEAAVMRQRERRRARLEVAGGPMMLNAALFTLDDATGLCVAVKRIDFREALSPP